LTGFSRFPPRGVPWHHLAPAKPLEVAMDETRLTGALPNMNVEIIHHTAPDGSAERLTIHLTATPDFHAALPLLGALGQMPLLLANPFAAWVQAMRMMMGPFAGMVQTNPLTTLMYGDFLGRDKK
jgi:hypothetical protein